MDAIRRLLLWAFHRFPGDNSKGYADITPLSEIARYNVSLRIFMGAMDGIAHVQNTLQFANALEEGGKHFELMLYPGRRPEREAIGVY